MKKLPYILLSAYLFTSLTIIGQKLNNNDDLDLLQSYLGESYLTMTRTFGKPDRKKEHYVFFEYIYYDRDGDCPSYTSFGIGKNTTMSIGGSIPLIAVIIRKDFYFSSKDRDNKITSIQKILKKFGYDYESELHTWRVDTNQGVIYSTISAHTEVVNKVFYYVVETSFNIL